ncbi:hypothetical protein GCM10023155_15790 [Bremerella cremea]
MAIWDDIIPTSGKFGKWGISGRTAEILIYRGVQRLHTFQKIRVLNGMYSFDTDAQSARMLNILGGPQQPLIALVAKHARDRMTANENSLYDR